MEKIFFQNMQNINCQNIWRNRNKMNLKPITTEKAVMIIEKENTMTFATEKENKRDEIKKEIENLFDVKVENVRTLIKANKKYAYVKLKKEFPAIDVATKLGLI